MAGSHTLQQDFLRAARHALNVNAIWHKPGKDSWSRRWRLCETRSRRQAIFRGHRYFDGGVPGDLWGCASCI